MWSGPEHCTTLPTEVEASRQVLFLNWVPPSHVAEHDPHLLHLPHVPSTDYKRMMYYHLWYSKTLKKTDLDINYLFSLPMHTFVLHTFHSVRGPSHGNPPFLTGLLPQDLVLFFVPFPQVLVHCVQSLQSFHLPCNWYPTSRNENELLVSVKINHYIMNYKIIYWGL